MSANNEEIKQLKQLWLADPIFDLVEAAEDRGIFGYDHELQKFMDDQANKWATEREERLEYNTTEEAFLDWLDSAGGNAYGGSKEVFVLCAIANAVNRQAKATERLIAVLEKIAQKK